MYNPKEENNSNSQFVESEEQQRQDEQSGVSRSRIYPIYYKHVREQEEKEFGK